MLSNNPIKAGTYRILVITEGLFLSFFALSLLQRLKRINLDKEIEKNDNEMGEMKSIDQNQAEPHLSLIDWVLGVSNPYIML